MRMQYNVCGTCGAKDGRAGFLIGKQSGPMECQNCHNTRKTGEIWIDLGLPRTPEEINKTMAILDDTTLMPTK